jgi:uncharacterized circularly permuted ATP-grasp superfamily protein
VLGRYLSRRRELDEWAGRITREPDEYTVQAYLPLSQMPTWNEGHRRASRRARCCCACSPCPTAPSRGACCPAA